MHPDRGVQIDSRMRKHHVEDTLRPTHHMTLGPPSLLFSVRAARRRMQEYQR